LASPAFATRVRLGAFGLTLLLVWGTRSTPRLLRTIIALFILIRGWEVVRVGEVSFYVTILVIVTVKSVALPLLRRNCTSGVRIAGTNVGETDQM
jgi:hypothetical protein